MPKQNKKSCFILGLILLGACSKPQDKRSSKLLLDLWVKRESPVSQILERKLAAEGAEECMSDAFTEETLKAEIASIEKKYAKEKKMIGYFGDINLEDLPVPQATFLKKYGESFGDHSGKASADYRGCTDAPCVINKVYGQDSGVEGYAIYIWYLRVGNLLAIDNTRTIYVPIADKPGFSRPEIANGKYQGAERDFKDFLFSKDELYGFWRLSHMLQPPFTTLAKLKRIERIPIGHEIEGQTGNVCGLASSSGWIQLNDGCLTLNKDLDTGYFYQATNHELAHHVDFSLKSVSQSEKLLTISGWSKKEETVDNKVTVTFSILPNTKFVTGYAMSNPRETFAESLSLFLHDGDLTHANTSPSFYSTIKKDFYNDQGHKIDDIIDRIVTENSAKFLKETIDMTANCLEPEGILGQSKYFNGVQFAEKIPDLIKNCMGLKAEALEAAMMASAKVHEPMGCLITKVKLNGRSKLQKAWKEMIVNQIDYSYQKMKGDSQYLARIKSFYEQVSEDKGPGTVYVSCYAESDEKSCFDMKLKALAEKRVEKLKVTDAQFKEMVKLYIQNFEFLSVKSSVQENYSNFLKGQASVLLSASSELWESCIALKADDSERPTGTIFNVGEGYLVSSSYNCINAALPEKIKSVIRQFDLDGERVKDGKEELILTHMATPIIIEELKTLLSDSAYEEKKKIDNYIKESKESLRAGLKKDLTWATSFVDNNKIINDCKARGLKDISFEPLYHQKKSVMDPLLKEICESIPQSLEFVKYLNSIRENLEADSYSTLEGYVLDFGAIAAKECLVKYPADTSLNRVKFRVEREACLKDKWPNVEKSALTKISNEPLIVKFSIDTSGYADKVKARQRILQVKVIKEYFEK